MGRYYHGDIEGKFWFGVQDSDDATFFYENEPSNPSYYQCCYNEWQSGMDYEKCPDCTEAGEAEENEEVLYYYFQNDEDSKAKIQEGITKCLDALKVPADKRDEMTGRADESQDAFETRLYDLMQAYYKVDTDEEKWAARLLLGAKIAHCVLTKDRCELYANCC